MLSFPIKNRRAATCFRHAGMVRRCCQSQCTGRRV